MALRDHLIGGCLSLCLTAVAAGQAAAPPNCDRPEYRQFDFWVGEWDVSVRGEPAGTNSITVEESGCLIHEHWRGKGGGTGQSFNVYDRQDRRWHQVWVANDGEVLWLAGEYQDGQLEFAGEGRTLSGAVVRHRLIFHPNPDGTVRQQWDISTDAGRTWQSNFDGLYRKRSQ